MLTVRKHIGFDLPVSINLDELASKELYTILLQVGRDAGYSNQSRVLAMKLSDAINKIHM